MRIVSMLFFCLLTWTAQAASIPAYMPTEQQRTFRSWLVLIVEDQIVRGANPRWTHRDCAGLVRFAVSESLATHDFNWRRSNGFVGRALPAELELTPERRRAFKEWKSGDGTSSSFARALPLIQQNTVYLGKTLERVEPGDLLFFDQGEDQHLMLWTGRRIVYHNGQRPPRHGKQSGDNGLRAVAWSELMSWNDSRWRPVPENPNFIGFFRFSFLTRRNERGAP